MTKIVAITGGIGAGKSTFSNVIKKKGFRLLDSDEVVSAIYKKPSKEFLDHLNNINLGESIKNGKINKKYISKVIFSNKSIKKKLEKYIFNKTKESRKKFIENEKAKKTKIVFFDIPLLFENNLSKNFNQIITIISSRKNRFKRLKKSKKMTKTLFNKILESQTTDLVRIKKSDIIIYNNKTKKDYLKKIENTLNKINI